MTRATDGFHHAFVTTVHRGRFAAARMRVTYPSDLPSFHPPDYSLVHCIRLLWQGANSSFLFRCIVLRTDLIISDLMILTGVSTNDDLDIAQLTSGFRVSFHAASICEGRQRRHVLDCDRSGDIWSIFLSPISSATDVNKVSFEANTDWPTWSRNTVCWHQIQSSITVLPV